MASTRTTIPLKSDDFLSSSISLSRTSPSHRRPASTTTTTLLGFTLFIAALALIPGSEAAPGLRHKRALDNLMGGGFTGFDKRAFDSLGHDGFSPFDKRNFFPVRIMTGFNKRAVAKRALDSIGYGGLSDFGFFDKRAFDTLGHDGFSGFERR